jgi:hypothetical protein
MPNNQFWYACREISPCQYGSVIGTVGTITQDIIHQPKPKAYFGKLAKDSRLTPMSLEQLAGKAKLENPRTRNRNNLTILPDKIGL